MTEIITNEHQTFLSDSSSNAFFYVIISKDIIIYNQIRSTSGLVIYPDLTFSHPFMEAALTDDAAFESMECAIKKYGISHCFCISAPPLKFKELTEAIQGTFVNTHSFFVKDNPLFTRLCDDLNLSVSMKSSLEQYLMYESFFTDIDEFIHSIYLKHDLPAQSKKEGKEIYEWIKHEITG